MESDIAFFGKALNNAPISKYFTRAADLRRKAFEAILWNESWGQWLDYWLPLQKPSAKLRKVINSSSVVYPHKLILPLLCLIMCLIVDLFIDVSQNVYMWDTSRSNRHIYASNFLPLWCGIFPPGDAKIDQVVEALSTSGLVMPGGIATSLMETGQQWFVPPQSLNSDMSWASVNRTRKNLQHVQGDIKLLSCVCLGIAGTFQMLGLHCST